MSRVICPSWGCLLQLSDPRLVSSAAPQPAGRFRCEVLAAVRVLGTGFAKENGRTYTRGASGNKLQHDNYRIQTIVIVNNN